MNRQIERWQLVPPAISLSSGTLLCVLLFVVGCWTAVELIVPLLWINGLAIVWTVLGTSVARGDPNLGRAFAIFVGLLVAHAALGYWILMLCWYVFYLILGVPPSP